MIFLSYHKHTAFPLQTAVVRSRVRLMSQESVSTLELEEEIEECLSTHSKLLDYSRNAETLIIPTNQCIPMMWSTEQNAILTEHFNYYEQMSLVIKQIKESGPQASKPPLPKRPKSKLDSLFIQAKKKKTFDPKELHDYLRGHYVDQCGMNKQFIVEDMWDIQETIPPDQFLIILKRATRQIQRCEAQMLLFYIKFGAFLEHVKNWHEELYNNNVHICCHLGLYTLGHLGLYIFVAIWAIARPANNY